MALRKHKVDTPEVYAALATVGQAVDGRIKAYGNVSRTPAAAVEKCATTCICRATRSAA